MRIASILAFVSMTVAEVTQSAWMASVPSPQVKISILPNDEIDTYRRFLFYNYCKVDGWYPPPGDPAKFRVEGDMLLDDRDTLSTHFVARLPDDTLVGCARVSYRLNGKFQIQLYDHRNDYTAYGAELSRFAVLPEYRDTDIALQLMHAVTEYATSKQLLACSGIAGQDNSDHYQKLGWTRVDGFETFRYFEDGDKVAFVHGLKDLDEQAEFVKKIEIAL